MIWDTVKGFFTKYLIFILLGVIVGMAAYGTFVIYGLKKQIEAHENTIKTQTTKIAELTANNAVLEKANQDFKKEVSGQNDKIAEWQTAADKAQKESAEELAKAKAESRRYREAYSFLWTKEKVVPADQCSAFFGILNRYIDQRQGELKND